MSDTRTIGKFKTLFSKVSSIVFPVLNDVEVRHPIIHDSGRHDVARYVHLCQRGDGLRKNALMWPRMHGALRRGIEEMMPQDDVVGGVQLESLDARAFICVLLLVSCVNTLKE